MDYNEYDDNFYGDNYYSSYSTIYRQTQENEQERIKGIFERKTLIWHTENPLAISEDLRKTKDKSRIIGYLTKLDSDGQTLLHNLAMGSIRNYQTSLLEIMLKYYQMPEYKDYKDILNRSEETALHVAVMSKNYSFLRLFVSCKPIASFKCHRNLTPLDMAVWMEDGAAAEIIATLPTSLLTVELPKNLRAIKGVKPSADADSISPFYQWGQMFTTQLSLGKTSIPQTVLFNHHQEHGVSNVQFGGNFALMLTDTGLLYSWGLCSYGKLGQYSKNDCPIPSQIMELKNKQITAIACGKDHSLALDEIGCIYSWGNGAGGRLGLNRTDVVSLPTMIAHFPDQVKIVGISCGQDHSMAVCDRGRVFSWGQGNFGKLGYQTVYGFQSTPRRIETIAPCKQISCGNWHSLVLTTSGDVYAFGSNREGRCGLPPQTKETPPTRIEFVIGGTKIKKIGAGLNFNAVLSTSNMIYTWGNNDKGQLGVIIQSDPKLRSIDQDTYTHKPQLVRTLLPFPINNIEVGYEHVIVLTDAGEVYSFGSNAHEQLGQGETLRDAGSVRKVETPNKSTVFKISAGNYASLISLSSGHNIFGAEMAQLLNDERYIDLRFIVNSNPSEYVNAHRFIVASRSVKLHRLLEMEIQNPNNSNKIPLSQTTSITTSTVDGIIYLNFPSFTSLDPVKLLVKFLYTDHAPLIQSQVHDLGILASCLQIERLSYICNISSYKSLETIPTSSLLDDFKLLGEQEYLNLYGDIQFNITNNTESSTKVSFKSYKAMLSLRSQYFQMMFQGQFSESTKNEINMFEVDPSSFQHLLTYLYCNQVPDDPNQCLELLFLADIHQIPRAKELCASIIRPSIDSDSICSIYRLAINLNVKPLIIWCEAKIPTMPNPQQLPDYDSLPSEVKLSIEKKMGQLTDKLNQLTLNQQR